MTDEQIHCIVQDGVKRMLRAGVEPVAIANAIMLILWQVLGGVMGWCPEQIACTVGDVMKDFENFDKPKEKTDHERSN